MWTQILCERCGASPADAPVCFFRISLPGQPERWRCDDHLYADTRVSAMVRDVTASIRDSGPGGPLCEDEGCPHHGTPHVCVESPEPPITAFDDNEHPLVDRLDRVQQRLDDALGDLIDF